MAYMNQERKAVIAKALKQVVPQGWKYSLAVRNHSTICMTISEAPFELIKAFKGGEYFNPETATHADVNQYHVREQIEDEVVADVLINILSALNTGNHDRSDSQIDYFDVGWYVDLDIGKWNKPFVCTAKNPVMQFA